MALILDGSISYCHQSRSLIVQSREGGFVTQNCLVCGKPRSLSFSELPGLLCGKCNNPLEPFIDSFKNYAYKCLTCGTSFELASVVPSWEEHFDYDGFAIDSDYDENMNNKWKSKK